MNKIHPLKILPKYYLDVISGHKCFEIRENDRDFQVGDYVILREWDGKEYTGSSMKVKITYITDYMQRDGQVVFGFRKLTPKEELFLKEELARNCLF
nr:DUF3850 domain-containing protein [Listeria aquatica]